MSLLMLAGGKPVPFTLLDKSTVLFLDANGQPAALKDRCCRRTAALCIARLSAWRRSPSRAGTNASS